jgi:hypothetical protein
LISTLAFDAPEIRGHRLHCALAVAWKFLGIILTNDNGQSLLSIFCWHSCRLGTRLLLLATRVPRLVQTKEQNEMKNLILTGALAGALLTLAACKGPMGDVGRVWPDGASVTMKGVHATASMTGGAFDAQEISWIGTNGYPFPSTNATTVVTEPLTARITPQAETVRAPRLSRTPRGTNIVNRTVPQTLK